MANMIAVCTGIYGEKGRESTLTIVLPQKKPKIVIGFNFSSSKHLVYRTFTFHDIYY